MPTITRTPVYSPAKTVVAIAAAGAVFLQGAIRDGVQLSDWAGLAGALVTAFAVYALPNLRGTEYGYAKGAVAVLGAICTGLVLALTNNNLSSPELVDIFIQAAGAIGVIAVPNKLISPNVQAVPDEDSPLFPGGSGV